VLVLGASALARQRLMTLALASSCWVASACAGAAAERAAPPANGRAASQAAPVISRALQSSVELELQRRVGAARGANESTVRVKLFPPTSAPQRVLLVAADSQGRGIQVHEVTMDARGRAHLASVIAPELPPAELDAAPPNVELRYKALSTEEATRLLQRAALAVSAEIDAEIALLPPENPSKTQVFGVRLWTADGRMTDRLFSGRPGNVAEPRRAPVALVREDLEALAVSADRTGINSDVRTMIVDAWPRPGTMPEWTRARLLAVASALPSDPLIALVRPALDEVGEPRVRAINALAAATAVDLRQDASGGLRGVDEVAEAYRQMVTKR